MNKEPTILLQLPLDMIKCFPLDKIHLIDEGVVNKIITLWLGKPGPQKLIAHQIEIIDSRLRTCSTYTPNEFRRSIRDLGFYKHFKVPEFRVFLPYTGPIVLEDVLEDS